VFDPLLQQLLRELPEVRDLLEIATTQLGTNSAALERVVAELRAMRQSEAMGYLHHAELHQRQALALLREFSQ
jgi:hypothetical protein